MNLPRWAITSFYASIAAAYPIGRRSRLACPAQRRANRRCGNFNDDIEVPVTPAVTREVGAIGDFSIGQRTRVENPKGVTGEAESIAFTLEFPITDDAGSIFNNKASTALQSVPFTPRPEGRGFSGQI